MELKNIQFFLSSPYTTFGNQQISTLGNKLTSKIYFKFVQTKENSFTKVVLWLYQNLKVLFRY